MGQVQQHIVFVGSAAAAFTHLIRHCTSHNIAGSQVFNGGCIAFHETLTVRVTQDATLTAGAFRHQNTQPGQPGGVELHEFHVLQRQAATQGDCHTVTGEGVRVRGGLEDLAAAAGGEHHRFCLEDVHFTGCQVVGDNPGGAGAAFFIFDHHQIEHIVLVVKLHIVAHAVLVEGLQDHVAGAVGGVACAAYRCFTVVAGVTAEPALVNTPLGGAVEGKTHFFKVEHGIDGFFRHNLCRILIDEVVTAFDGVKRMPLPVVFLDVSQCGAHTALGGAGVGAGGV